jgi:hypothetical protein
MISIPRRAASATVGSLAGASVTRVSISVKGATVLNVSLGR